MIATAFLASLAVTASAQNLDWIGQTYDGTAVQLWSLTPSGSRGAARGNIPLPAGSTISTDLFRCQPYGLYCQFIAQDATGAASLYNATLEGVLVGKVALPAADRITSLHVDAHSGRSYFTAHTGSGAAVLSVSSDGAAQLEVDLTPYLHAGAALTAGGATHCSNRQTLWLAASNGTAGSLLTIDLAAQRVAAQTPLAFPGFASMWADCGEFDKAGDLPSGIVYDAKSRTLSYGAVGAGGTFVPSATAQVPTGLQPSGLLSFADVFNSQYNYFAALYPAGAAAGATPAKGQLAFFDANGPGMTLTPVDYFLAGAALS